MSEPCLALHGGAGAREPSAGELGFLRSLHAEGLARLQAGDLALDVVTQCVMKLEDAEYFNAGRGSVLNAAGEVEMDAGIMDGRDLAAGAVAAIRRARNPIQVARAVMEKTPHLLLVGTGADAFAASLGLPAESGDYFVTEPARERWRDAQHLGTVGAAACDRNGDLAAATSTGGLTNKMPGRVGDTPLIGAGVYADNRSCAVSATGNGEDCMRTLLARKVAELIERDGLDAQSAADAAIAHLIERVGGAVAVIVVDAKGRSGIAKSTEFVIAAL